ncbi:hypothetical protein evm_000871 [Chilo suppressalis]|nr:hypothetical protein evm_000871 [Chilo suppressalis]
MSDELALATGFYYLSSCYYFMLCVKKYKIDLSPQSTLNLKLRKRRRCWMRTIYRKRNKKSMENIFQKLLAEPSGGFHNFCGMSFEDFEILLQKLGPFISKKDTGWREAIPAKIRLALTLRFLASGESYKSLHCLFKISHQVISKIVMEVCTSLCQVLNGEVKVN